MIVERILGNLFDGESRPQKPVDALRLDWQDCHRRAVRGQTDSGQKIGVLLPLGESLRHGDILVEDDASRVACMVRETQVLIVEPESSAAMTLLAAELGNLHAPMEIREDHIVTVEDGPVLEVLRRCNSEYRRERMIFQPRRSLALPAIKDATRR